MIKACGYIRVSTEGQVKQGYSLGEQKEEIEKYCKENSYELVGVYKDEGISGAKANEDDLSIDREGFVDMLAALKTNDVRYIIVLSTSRLWRSDMVKVLIQRELKKLGVDVKAIDRPTYSICSSDPADVLMNGIFEVLDSYERLEIALKLKRGRMQKAKSGGYSGGGVPYGYVALRGSKGILLEPKEAEAVRRVFELKRMCPWSTLQEIAETLNEEGYHGKNGGVFNLMLAKRIIEKKDFYRGIYKYGGIEAYGKHPAII